MWLIIYDIDAPDCDAYPADPEADVAADMLIELQALDVLLLREVYLAEDSIYYSAVDVVVHSDVVTKPHDVLYEFLLLHCFLIVHCLLIVDVVDQPNDVDADLDSTPLLDPAAAAKVSIGCSEVDVVTDLL